MCLNKLVPFFVLLFICLVTIKVTNAAGKDELEKLKEKSILARNKPQKSNCRMFIPYCEIDFLILNGIFN